MNSIVAFGSPFFSRRWHYGGVIFLRIASKWPLTTRGNKAPARAFIPIALRGFIMETEHTEGVIEKALAFVKHTLGIPPVDQTPDVVAKPEYIDTAPEPTIEGAMRLDPHAYAFNKIVERSRHSTATSREIADTDSPVDAHMQAAAQIDRARDSAEKALDEIQHISRGMRETNPENNFPSEREMEEFERADKQHSAGW